ncbi:MAG: VOC family protein [Eubacteriales bacterium]|nr:VOC family protein [Eubacteriales bacterium]
MIKEVAHIGLTVSDMDQSIEFYQKVLGLDFKGEILMEGPETDRLFGAENTKARVAYLNGSDELIAPPVELIQFLNCDYLPAKNDLRRLSISELCFRVEDIDAVYERLLEHGVECLSEPQNFDFTKDGFGKSKAIYFKDPDGIILELMEYLD